VERVCEPVVVAVCGCCPEPRRAFLADVLIVAADRAPAVRPAELFERHPGLTVALVTGRGRCVVAGVRDGTVLALRHRAGHPPANAVRAAAVLLYRCWCLGITPSAPEGLRLLAAAGFDAAAPPAVP
jgi:hypothetical protein